MKKLTPLIILFILIIGCNEKNNKVEVIRLNDSNYFPMSEVDSTTKVLAADYNTSINNQIAEKIKKGDITEDEFKKYSLMLFVNESGKLDKIVVMNAPNEEIANFLINTLPEQTFKPATKNGKPIKYKFGWYYSGEYLVTADPMPEPIGGIDAIQKNIVYPEIARRAGIEGRVYVLALINENGDVAKTKIIKGIGAGCDEAAANAVKKVKFKPGMLNGVPVKVQVTVPVIFKLSNK